MYVILVICLWQGSGWLFLTDIESEARQCDRSEESYPDFDSAGIADPIALADSGLNFYDSDDGTGE